MRKLLLAVLLFGSTVNIVLADGSATPTPFLTMTPTFTKTPTPTKTPTKTITPTFTKTATRTATNSPTPTATLTPTITRTPTNSPTKTPTNTPTNTPTLTFTNVYLTGTPTVTPTFYAGNDGEVYIYDYAPTTIMFPPSRGYAQGCFQSTRANLSGGASIVVSNVYVFAHDPTPFIASNSVVTNLMGGQSLQGSQVSQIDMIQTGLAFSYLDPAPTLTPTISPTPIGTRTNTLTPTPTFTINLTDTVTFTPTVTLTPTPTGTRTPVISINYAYQQYPSLGGVQGIRQ